MTYETLIKTISAIVENDDIYKVGLTLSYHLPALLHKQMNEELFIRSNSNSNDPIPDVKDVYELEIDGIIIKFFRIQVI